MISDNEGSFYMKKLLLLFCSLLLVAGCGKPAATLPTVIGSGSVDIPAYKITAPAAGKILGLILESGERIGKGQPLFAIEQPELDAAVEDAFHSGSRVAGVIGLSAAGRGGRRPRALRRRRRPAAGGVSGCHFRAVDSIAQFARSL